MRQLALPLAVALTLAGTLPALAGAGLPKIATLEPGPYRATLYNDSPGLLTGRNALTVEVSNLPEPHRVFLTLVGPTGQRVDMPLRPVLTLDSPGESQTAGADDHGKLDEHAPAADAHATAPDRPASTNPGHGGHAVEASAPAHGATTAEAAAHEAAPVARLTQDDHAGFMSEHDRRPGDSMASGHPDERAQDHGAAYLGRVVVDVPEPGTWKAVLMIREASGAVHVDEALLEAREGGPNRLYLGVTGALIGGFLLYGAIQRRRQPSTSKGLR